MLGTVACSSSPSSTAADSATAAASAPGSSAGSSAAAGIDSSAGASSPASSTGGPSAVTITITQANGCAVAPDTVPAGPVTFTVTNVDAPGITEIELLSDQRIRGERENLAPGFEDSFSATLDGGSYLLYCPGAKDEKVSFTVTGSSATATGTVTDLLKQATVDYAAYVDSQTAMLVPAVEDLQKAIASGDLAAAQEAYAKARPYYERIEPVAESFGDLDPAIDARAGDVPAADWTGFHPIEKALFEDKTVKGLGTLASKLVTDVKDLQTRALQLSASTRSGTGDGYKPDEVANGAVELLSEVQQSKITGEEERYSHIDLLDFSANVEGSLQAFAALKPALNEIDATLVPNISTRFDQLIADLDTYRSADALGGFVLYDDLKPADTKKLTASLLAVIEPMSQLSGKIVTA